MGGVIKGWLRRILRATPPASCNREPGLARTAPDGAPLPAPQPVPVTPSRPARDAGSTRGAADRPHDPGYLTLSDFYARLQARETELETRLQVAYRAASETASPGVHHAMAISAVELEAQMIRRQLVWARCVDGV